MMNLSRWTAHKAVQPARLAPGILSEELVAQSFILAIQLGLHGGHAPKEWFAAGHFEVVSFG